MVGIYKINSIVKPERSYIGSAVNIRKRLQYHIEDLRRGKHHNIKLQRHYNKYGESDLLFSIILGECDKSDLIFLEQIFINSYIPWFNICKIAGSTLGIKYSEEVKIKMRHPKAGIQKPRGPMPLETKLKISLKKIGVSNPGAKNSKSEECKLKISNSLKNKTKTQEHKNKIGLSLLGKKRGSYKNKCETTY